MERISELLDNVGWSQQDESTPPIKYEWKRAAFAWMTEATNRIQELDYRTQKLLELNESLIGLQAQNQRNLDLLLGVVRKLGEKLP